MDLISKAIKASKAVVWDIEAHECMACARGVVGSLNTHDADQFKSIRDAQLKVFNPNVQCSEFIRRFTNIKTNTESLIDY